MSTRGEQISSRNRLRMNDFDQNSFAASHLRNLPGECSSPFAGSRKHQSNGQFARRRRMPRSTSTARAGALIDHRVMRSEEHCAERGTTMVFAGAFQTLSPIPPSGGLVGQEFQRASL